VWMRRWRGNQPGAGAGGAAAGEERRRLEWGWRESVDTGIEEAVSSLEGTRCFARRQRQCIHFSVVNFFASFVIYGGRHDRGMHVLVECLLVTPSFAKQL
jgi:hypothetical protein